MRITMSELNQMIYESITNALKPDITVLWLDDLRNPYKYFKKKYDPTNRTIVKNYGHYEPIMKNNNVNFVWVKNFNEFTNYIMQNGIPEYVSFDHDLGKDEKKGYDCAMWLLDFCKQNSIKLPNCFVHSANKNGSAKMCQALGIPNDFENV